MVDLQRKYEEEKKIKEEMEEAALEDVPLLAEEVPIEEEEEATSTNYTRIYRVWKRGEDMSGKVWRRRGGGDCWVGFTKEVGRRRKWWRRSICRLGLGKKKV